MRGTVLQTRETAIQVTVVWDAHPVRVSTLSVLTTTEWITTTRAASAPKDSAPDFSRSNAPIAPATIMAIRVVMASSVVATSSVRVAMASSVVATSSVRNRAIVLVIIIWKERSRATSHVRVATASSVVAISSAKVAMASSVAVTDSPVSPVLIITMVVITTITPTRNRLASLTIPMRSIA